MLGKLLKHEMRALSRYLLPLHAIVLIMSIIGHFTVTVNADRYPKYAALLLIITYIALLFAVSICTFIIIAIRFYKNLFTDEGYLTLTLPAGAGQHLACKSITAVIWLVISLLTIMCSIWLLCVTPAVLREIPQINAAYYKQTGFSLRDFFTLMMSAYMIELVVAPSYIFVCISVGQLFSNHRVLGAIISYCLLCGAFQVVNIIFLFTGGYLPYLFRTSELTGAFYRSYMEYVVSTNLVFGLAAGVLCYIGTYFILKHKVNIN